MVELKEFSTNALVDELRKREGVKGETAEPYQVFEVYIGGEKIDGIPDSGPAVILVIWD
jgi:hypothetical protein